VPQVHLLYVHCKPEEEIPRDQVGYNEDDLFRIAAHDLEAAHTQGVADGVEHPPHEEGDGHPHHEMGAVRPLESVHEAVQHLQAVDREGDDHSEARGRDEDEEPLDDEHVLVGLGGDHHENHELVEHEERHELHCGAAPAVRGHRDDEHEQHGAGEQPCEVAQPWDDCAVGQVHVTSARLNGVEEVMEGLDAKDPHRLPSPGAALHCCQESRELDSRSDGHEETRHDHRKHSSWRAGYGQAR